MAFFQENLIAPEFDEYFVCSIGCFPTYVSLWPILYAWGDPTDDPNNEMPSFGIIGRLGLAQTGMKSEGTRGIDDMFAEAEMAQVNVEDREL